MARYHDAPLYLQIADRGTNARVRLAVLRKEAASGSGNWRTARAWTLRNWSDAFAALSQGFNTKESHAWGKTTTTRTPVWYCHTGEQFRNERNADDVDGAGITHKGWFADVDCSRTVRGIVGSLSHGRFIAGTHSSDNGERVYFGKVFDNEIEAARWADDYAQDAAEKEHEYDERYQAAQELKDDITQACKDAARLYAIRNHATLGEDAREELREALAAIREKRDELKDDYSDVQV